MRSCFTWIAPLLSCTSIATTSVRASGEKRRNSELRARNLVRLFWRLRSERPTLTMAEDISVLPEHT